VTHDRTERLVPLSLLRCAAAILIIGCLLPGALHGIVELIFGLCQLHFVGPATNGTLDLLRQTIINQTNWGTVADRAGRHGLRLLLLVLCILLIRGQGPLMRLFRRLA
jgi:hypothetical protein